MRPGRIAILVAGVLVVLLSAGLIAGGAALLSTHLTDRDDTGFFNTESKRFETSTYAITSRDLSVEGNASEGEWVPLENVGQIRIRVRGSETSPTFVGIARQSDIDRYLANSSYATLGEQPFSSSNNSIPRSRGDVAPAPPATQSIWVVSSSGNGQHEVVWDVQSGEWGAVVMNADASPGVAIEASAGIKTDLLRPIALGLLLSGLLLAAIGTALLVVATRHANTLTAQAASTTATVYPVTVNATLDEPLSRWMWLIKWLLAIPHFLVLALLWVAFAVLTVVAGFSILFTRRYPAGIFEFNVGVLRWSWRVTYYAFTLGTDRYPPFSLRSMPEYPADLTVRYPEQLSRGLVLVKWWLLALPHYFVLTLFGGGTTPTVWNFSSEETQPVLGGGLIVILVVVAAVVLAVTGAYPRGAFDFILGMKRWSYRVTAYAALMRDEYPPFRMDLGGAEPVRRFDEANEGSTPR